MRTLLNKLINFFFQKGLCMMEVSKKKKFSSHFAILEASILMGISFFLSFGFLKAFIVRGMKFSVPFRSFQSVYSEMEYFMNSRHRCHGCHIWKEFKVLSREAKERD